MTHLLEPGNRAVLPQGTLSRRSLMRGTAGVTAAMIAGMTFPRVMKAQTPVAEIPAKELSGTAILTISGEPQSFNLNRQADDLGDAALELQSGAVSECALVPREGEDWGCGCHTGSPSRTAWKVLITCCNRVLI